MVFNPWWSTKHLKSCSRLDESHMKWLTLSSGVENLLKMQVLVCNNLSHSSFFLIKNHGLQFFFLLFSNKNCVGNRIYHIRSWNGCPNHIMHMKTNPRKSFEVKVQNMSLSFWSIQPFIQYKTTRIFHCEKSNSVNFEYNFLVQVGILYCIKITVMFIFEIKLIHFVLFCNCTWYFLWEHSYESLILKTNKIRTILYERFSY